MTTPGAPAPLSIVLRSARERIHVGDPVPVRVEVRNVSAAPVWILGVLDGSLSGDRYPRWVPVIEGPNGRLSPALEGAEYPSPLRPGDFRLLQPGESFDPTAEEAGYLPLSAFDAVSGVPGQYTVALELDTTAPEEAAWHVDSEIDRRPEAAAERPVVRARLAEVPRLRVRSNALTFNVDP